MVFNFIENNYVAVVISVFLILFTLTNNNFEKRVNRLFLAASSCILILIMEEFWEAQLALMSTPTTLRIVLSALGYSLRPMIPFFIVNIRGEYSKKQFALVTAPLVLNAIVAFSALFSPIAFGYNQNNQFVRGPLGYMPFIVATLYIVIVLIHTAQDWQIGGFKETLIVCAIVVLAFFSTVMESLLGFQFIQNPSMATSIAFYYLFLHTAQNNRDPLTGALTRRRFFLDATKYHSLLTAVISLDVNDLKKLNDQQGHVAGDKALVTVTKVVKKCLKKNSSLFRTGGDEFMILCYKLSEEEVQNMIQNIRDELKDTIYECAIGYAMYSSVAEFDFICQLADEKMYEDKRKTKRIEEK